MKHQSLRDEIPEGCEDLFIDAIFANMGVASSLFLCKITPYLRKDDYSASALATEVGTHKSGAANHLNRLALKEYVFRSGHTSWSLGIRTINIRYPNVAKA